MGVERVRVIRGVVICGGGEGERVHMVICGLERWWWLRVRESV